jgi:hypothetical protein
MVMAMRMAISTMTTTTVMMATAMIGDGGCVDGDSGNDNRGGNTTIK